MLILAFLTMSVFQSYGETTDNRLIIISPKYDYIVEYDGLNYIVVNSSIEAYPSLLFKQTMKYIKRYFHNYSDFTNLDSVQAFNKIKDINESRFMPIKNYIKDIADELGLDIGKIHLLAGEPPIITLELYYTDDSVIEALWGRIRDKAIEYNVIIEIAKRMSPPEYMDEVDYYVHEVVDHRDIFYKNGVDVVAIGFGYTYNDAVWIDVNMTNPSRDYVMKVVKLARQIVDDPRIPVVIQFKIMYDRPLILKANKDNDSNTNNRDNTLNRDALITSILITAIPIVLIILRKLRK